MGEAWRGERRNSPGRKLPENSLQGPHGIGPSALLAREAGRAGGAGPERSGPLGLLRQPPAPAVAGRAAQPRFWIAAFS